jgi:hypothetical protein
MASADSTRVENHIKHILNAVAVWGASVNSAGKAIYSDEAVTQARIESGTEILRAIASNPQHGDHGSLAALVTVAHNAFVPAHDGEPGIPIIVPFSGGTAIDGVPATPDEIDSYRLDPATYTGQDDGASVAHDASSGGLPSPISARYSIVNGRFKYTGYSAQIPLIQLTRSMADTGVPDVYEPTLVKLSIPKLLKEGDNLSEIVALFAQAGQQDLVEIASGERIVSPIPDVATAQKGGVT